MERAARRLGVRTRAVGVVYVSAALAAALFVSCGGKPEIIQDDSPFGSGGNGTRDGGFVRDARGPIFDFDSGGPSDCVPKSCDDLDAECGEVVDGCNGVLDCGECDDDEACSIETPNQCTKLISLCRPISKADACDGKECGVESDGCDDTYDCGECNDDESCGAEAPFECSADQTEYDEDNCPAKIESCKSAGARCDVIGNGCGGTIDCTAELGACPNGTVCGAVDPYQCDEPTGTGTTNCTPAASCAELGWACGLAVDDCGNVHDCAAEGRTCGPLETCVGGITGPTRCTAPGASACPLCSSVPDCAGEPQLTRLTGRVVSPGRNNNDVANQVGVPNAFVYILRTNNLTDLPDIPSGIPSNGTSCDRCDEQDLGPILTGTTTDATGHYTLEGNIPVGKEFVLVVKVGKFRRAVRHSLPAAAACETTSIPEAVANNLTRLPRNPRDGLAANIPHVAVSTGQIDAMECVFEKMGIGHGQFGNPGANGTAAARIHIYRGGPTSGSPPGAGARINNSTPQDAELYGELDRMLTYDMVVADCEGPTWDNDFSERDAYGDNVREYVNRGGRLFTSHLSFSWLHQNGTTAYSNGNRVATGLGPAATWQAGAVTGPDNGPGRVAVGRPRASPRIQNFTNWMINEGVIDSANDTFNIVEPRSQATGLGNRSEEFVYCSGGGDCTGNSARTQQFSFNAPYGAPNAAVCGRVAYSGFHVVAGGSVSAYQNAVFPNHCTGSLSDQEKVLLYMLFDLGTCVGDEPPPPKCTPEACAPSSCGVQADGCGKTIDCGECPPGCKPTTCEAQDAECGKIGDGCGKVLDCGVCRPGQVCGITAPNECGDGECSPRTCKEAKAECGKIGDGCGKVIDCGPCPEGEVCGLETAFQCDPPSCEPTTCAAEKAQCGPLADGCGRVIDCGDCPSGGACGRDAPNKCSQVQ